MGSCFPSGSVVKNPPAMQEPQGTQVWSLGQADPLEENMATHSSIPAWRIPCREEPAKLQSTGLWRVGHDWSNLGNGNPFQYSCLENPRDRGAWWAAVYGVTQSRTWLTRPSSSSRHFGHFLPDGGRQEVLGWLEVFNQGNGGLSSEHIFFFKCFDHIPGAVPSTESLLLCFFLPLFLLLLVKIFH